VVTDPVRQITTLESSSGSVISTYGGVGTHAEFAPDSATVYITAGNQLLVYSNYTGWTSVSPATSGGTPVKDVAITSPAVGAYFAGSPTTARGYCPISTPLTATSESNFFYPPADSSPAITDRIAATNDGLHIIGASVTPVPTLSDLRVNIPSTNTGTTSVSIACPTVGGLTFSNTLSTTLLSPITATTITGVWPTSDSSLAFVTYTGSGGVVPAYAPAASGPGTATYVKLSGAAVAPVSGVVSADNTTFYVGTTGDNLVHLINRSTLTDSSTLTPNLTNPTGTVVPVDLLVQKPRKTT
jgi:trimeric autotransporter adhesin